MATGRSPIRIDPELIISHKFPEVLPTFAALFPFKSKKDFLLADVPGLDFDPKLLLHGQQYIEIYRPLPSSCSVENRVSIVGLHDKGKAAIVEVETTSYARGSGEALCMNRTTVYLRGAGGFSKNPKAYSYATNSRDQVPSIVVPGQEPSVIYEDQTQQSQACSSQLPFFFLLLTPPMITCASFTKANPKMTIRTQHGH
ncbi:hypothetical protein HPP92_013945 [Vanilla planifolia]|uniref:Peroxisomal multifunctional enzyme type 2-like N-terminal domain-containing protein n=1 Tax=Vanilla planifolia TaxID=51239 RepID=A0A835QKG2_VANPL|nr:hypothetical protein HPP92_013945 [Vanilla planifolia]